MEYQLDDDQLCDSEDDGLQFSSDEIDGGCGSKDEIISVSQTLTPDMISKKMFDIIAEVNDVFQVCCANSYELV